MRAIPWKPSFGGARSKEAISSAFSSSKASNQASTGKTSRLSMRTFLIACLMAGSLSYREKQELYSLLQEKARRISARTATEPTKGNLEKYCPHAPTPKQGEFLSLQCKEALYGGAAGGGKSDALLMAALQYVHVPGYSAILFRRTYQDLSLPDALIPRSMEWLRGTDAKWDNTTHSWLFPSGAKVAFGYCDSLGDEYRYQGAAFQFIGWDELTQFEEAVYLYLFSRLRTVQNVNVPLRVRGATNPGGIGHRWVKRRFIDPTTKEPDAIYVPAKVSDNPHLRGDYVDSLSYLDAVTKARYLDGDWLVIEDNVFVYPFDRGVHVASPPPGTEFKTVIGGIDPGTRDPYAVGVWALDWDGCWWGLDELYVTGQTSSSLANAIRQLSEKHNVKTWWVDKRKPSDIIDLNRADLHALPNLDVHAETDRDTIRPMIGVCLNLMRRGKLKFGPRMKWHIYEAENYRYHDAEEKNAGEVPIDKDNHAMDAMRYAICSVAELPTDMRPRYRTGSDMMPRARGKDPNIRPGTPIAIPSAKEYLMAQEKRFEQRLHPGRRQRT